MDRREPATVFATACTGIWRSRNGGASWAKVLGIPSVSRRTRAFAILDTLFAPNVTGDLFGELASAQRKAERQAYKQRLSVLRADEWLSESLSFAGQ